MYIEPNSTVILCKNIPFNNNYEATMWFGDTVAQFAFFTAQDKVVEVFQKQSYVRPSGSLGGTIDVKELADNLYNVNYMVFQNTNFGSKWFYAFVTNVEYINNKTTRLTFEIDVMQTWMFDYTLNECFVEREHSATDEIGDNLINEGLELGDYYFEDLGMSEFFGGNYLVIVATSFDDVVETETGYERIVGTGNLYGGLYSGLQYKAFNTTESGIYELNSWLKRVTEANYSDGIVSMYMIPEDLIGDFYPSGNPVARSEGKLKADLYNIGGYACKNNKLYTYPYNLLGVSSSSGEMAEYHIEYFGLDSACYFTLSCVAGAPPEAQIVPLHYKGSESGQPNYNERLLFNNFPQCAYTIDAYRAWIAQNSTIMNANVLSSGIQGAISGFSSGSNNESFINKITGGLVGGTVGAVGGAIGSALPTVISNLAQTKVASTLPPHANGSPTGCIDIGWDTIGFRYYHIHIRPEFAKIIDDFFQKYGYATKQVKVPNVNVREHWTYTKTIGCTINGALPADDESAICTIFDSGITFFKDEASFTQQSSLYNRPLSEVNVSG